MYNASHVDRDVPCSLYILVQSVSSIIIKEGEKGGRICGPGPARVSPEKQENHSVSDNFS